MGVVFSFSDTMSDLDKTSSSIKSSGSVLKKTTSGMTYEDTSFCTGRREDGALLISGSTPGEWCCITGMLILLWIVVALFFWFNLAVCFSIRGIPQFPGAEVDANSPFATELPTPQRFQKWNGMEWTKKKWNGIFFYFIPNYLLNSRT